MELVKRESDERLSRMTFSSSAVKLRDWSQVRRIDFAGAEFDEDLVELVVVLHVFGALLAGHQIERRLGDVEVAAFDQGRHVAAEERQQQGADVGAVHVGIGHDDDLVIADLVDVERAFLLAIADARADGGDEVLDFPVLQRAVEAGLLDVEDLAAQRQDRLGAAVAALFGGATGGVTFDNIELGFRGIALRAVGEFAGQAAA